MLLLLADSPQKLKLEKNHDTLIILFYVRPGSTQLQSLFFFYDKHKKASTAAVDPSISKLKLQAKIFLTVPVL